ncbi:TPA: AraC family transcriptional regulator [Streptococcus suis]
MFHTYNLKHSMDDHDRIRFDIISVTESTYDVNWYSVMHYHDFTEIFYCLSGQGFIQTKYGMQAIQENTLVLVNPYIEHTEHSDIHNPLHYIVIGVRGPEIIFPEKLVANDLFLFDDKQHAFLPYFKLIMDQIRLNKPYSDPIIDNLTNGLLLALSDNANSQLQDKRSEPLSAAVSLAKAFIDNNYSKQITLDDLEVKSHISKFHLSHQFKEELGMSPIHYLQEVRFENAVVLLTASSHSINQISDLVGFNSNHYFSRKFKERYGVSPKAYRKDYQASENARLRQD